MPQLTLGVPLHPGWAIHGLMRLTGGLLLPNFFNNGLHRNAVSAATTGLWCVDNHTASLPLKSAEPVDLSRKSECCFAFHTHWITFHAHWFAFHTHCSTFQVHGFAFHVHGSALHMYWFALHVHGIAFLTYWLTFHVHGSAFHAHGFGFHVHASAFDAHGFCYHVNGSTFHVHGDAGQMRAPPHNGHWPTPHINLTEQETQPTATRACSICTAMHRRSSYERTIWAFDQTLFPAKPKGSLTTGEAGVFGRIPDLRLRYFHMSPCEFSQYRTCTRPQPLRTMWIHGLGWFLPVKMECPWATTQRDKEVQSLHMLQPCSAPPLHLGLDRRFQHLLLEQPALPHGPPPTTYQVAQRHHPPTGLAIWPGHCLHLTLRVPWPKNLLPTIGHWPLHRWTPYLRTWHMLPCPQHTFIWRPGPWQHSSPKAFYPTKVYYHPISGHAVWSFCLKEH